RSGRRLRRLPHAEGRAPGGRRLAAGDAAEHRAKANAADLDDLRDRRPFGKTDPAHRVEHPTGANAVDGEFAQEKAEQQNRQACAQIDHGSTPSGPRPIATTPVRETSTSPSGSIKAMNCSILSLEPVISKMKLSVPASMVRARKASATRSASSRV